MIQVLSRFNGCGEWKPNGHIMSDGNNLREIHEHDYRYYVILANTDDEDDVRVIFAGASLLREAPIGNWDYDPVGDWKDDETIEDAFNNATPWGDFCTEDLPRLQDDGIILSSSVN